MRNYGALSCTEFEKLIGDLLGAHLGLRFERFSPGADQGIDLRHINTEAGPDVVQAKHYVGSSWSDLKKAVRGEQARLEKLDPAPDSYRFVTSLGLTPRRKSEVASLFGSFVESEDCVFGVQEIEDLLDQHPDVERRQIKLLLASATGLNAFIHAGVHNRSRQLVAEIEQLLPLWVQSETFFEAQERLADGQVVVISGQPGIGKTTLARILVAEAANRQFEPIQIQGDISEAWDVLDPTVSQIFLYDDFLGQTSLLELSKNEDSSLVALMREVSGSSNKLFVLTTREYVLQRGLQISEALRRSGLNSTKILLELPSYSGLDRARILANHVWHSDLPRSVRGELSAGRGYARIVNHPNFNPRLIEFITGHQGGHTFDVADGKTWLESAVEALNQPDDIWRSAYENQLGDAERTLVLCMASFTRAVHVDDLRVAHDSVCKTTGIPAAPARFNRALKVVDDSFLTIDIDREELMVSFANPGIRDFIERQLREDSATSASVIDSLVFFEQFQTLWRISNEDLTCSLHGALLRKAADVIRQLFRSPTSTWIVYRSVDDSEELKRYRPLLDARLATALAVADDADAPSEVREWVQLGVASRMDEWPRESANDGSGPALKLARLLLRNPRVDAPSGWELAMKKLMCADPATPDDWRCLLEFRELFPDAFTGEEWDGIISELFRWAESYLVYNAENIDSGDEIGSIEHLAKSLEVELDPSWIEHAQAELGHKEAAEDARSEMEYELWREGGRPGGSDEAAEMNQLFEKLAEE